MTQLLTQLATPALFGVLTTAALLLLVTDWRLRLAALGLQYVCAAILSAQIVIQPVAVARLLTGLLVVAILALTGRATERKPDAPAPLRFEFPTGFLFRVLTTAMGVVAAWVVASQPRFALPGLPAGLNIASYTLMALGLLNLGLTEAPLNAGLGLLMFLTGFQIFYAAIEPSLAIVALLAAVEFGVGLAVSYLSLLWHNAARESST